VVAPLLFGLFVVGVFKNAFFPGIWDWHLFSMYHLEFRLGVLVYQHRHQIGRFGSAGPLALGVAGFLVTAAVLSLIPGDHGVPVPAGLAGFLRIAGYGPASGLFLVGLLNAEERLRSSGLRHAALVGDASFALYLSHPIVLPALGRAFGALHVRPGMLVPALALAVAVAVGLSILFFLAIERPFLRYAMRLRVGPVGASPQASRLSGD
jgi:peptidoglycan/LPS O-acetylase OafA/YrhL